MFVHEDAYPRLAPVLRDAVSDAQERLVAESIGLRRHAERQVTLVTALLRHMVCETLCRLGVLEY